MDLRSIAFLMLLLLPSAAVLLSSQLVVVKGDTSIIRVPNDFRTIQEAINAAENGSTILVNGGVYHENLTIGKTLNLLGANKENTIIEGSNNTDGVTITADSVVVNGFTVSNNALGIGLNHSDGSTVSGNIVTLNKYAGIALLQSENNTVSGNIVSFNEDLTPGLTTGEGIVLESSGENTISDNTITESVGSGLSFEQGSNNNTIFGNTIQQIVLFGLFIDSSENNTFFHNNFFSFIKYMQNTTSANDVWSVDGRGNYWYDYTGLDNGAGGRTAGDSVGDTDLPSHGVDNYPLINPANPLLVFWDNMIFPTSFFSNSTVSAFRFDQANKEITFNVVGPANTIGYFNVSIPASLLADPWTIRLDGTDVTSQAAITENQTHTNIYLNYSHSGHSVQIIGTYVVPEYPTTSIFLLIILLLLPTTILVLKKRRELPDKQRELSCVDT
jgi:parallel beta-helix repeat protein